MPLLPKVKLIDQDLYFYPKRLDFDLEESKKRVIRQKLPVLQSKKK